MKITHALAIALIACASSGSAFAGAVNVNKADAKTIQKELTGIGAKTADGIVKERSNGAFKDENDFKNRVKGVGDKTIAKNKGNIRFAD